MDMVERIAAAGHDAYRAALSEMSQGIIPLWAGARGDDPGGVHRRGARWAAGVARAD